MKIHVVTATIHGVENLKKFVPMLQDHETKIVIVDEGNEKLREPLEVPHEYYGPSEREQWFCDRFDHWEKYLSVIPERCHAETSFGFLVAYEDQPDMVIELDDDVLPRFPDDITYHAKNFDASSGMTIYSSGKWYNTITNLHCRNLYELDFFPRGYPYNKQERKNRFYVISSLDNECVLNMGSWAGNPDLDASTLLSCSALNGLHKIYGIEVNRSKVVVAPGTYFPICSMNTAFRPKIIPAFYQLYMNYMGIDRFDDIWSGLFLKKIADHLGDGVCLGAPLVYHDKRPRNVFDDLRKEIKGIEMNEELWKIVDKITLEGKDYHDCYLSLIDGLRHEMSWYQFWHKYTFWLKQFEKMELWLEICDKVK